MTKDYEFLLEKRKHEINYLILEAISRSKKEGAKIENSKVIGDKNVLPEDYDIKNGKVLVTIMPINVLDSVSGAELLRRIYKNDFKFNKEEKITTVLRNTELNLLYKEDYDTGEITFKIFILDRMADAFDYGIPGRKEENKEENKENNTNKSSKKKEYKYDLSNSNKFEIVTLLKEIKIKKEELEQFVNEKNREYNEETYRRRLYNK